MKGVVKRNGDFLLRTKTNIRGSKTSEYSYSYECSFLAEYSVFCRIFGHFTEYLTTLVQLQMNFSQYTSFLYVNSVIFRPNIR